MLLLLAIAGMGAATVLITALKGGTLDLKRQRTSLLALAEAREALAGYAASHGRLPRPAASSTDGRERGAACDSDVSCTGLLPWVTLGLRPGDGWDKLLGYSVTPGLTAEPVNLALAEGNKTVQRRDNRGQLSYLIGQGECDLSAPCAALVVYSSGRQNLGTSVAGVRQANAVNSNVDEQTNDAATRHFVLRGVDDNPDLPGGPFDDLVGWIALKPILQRMAIAPSPP